MLKYVIITIFILIFNSKAYSLELVMIDSKACYYCKKFLKEVAPEFNISKFPLVIVQNNNLPKWFSEAYKKKRIKPYKGTPVFIIWDEIEKYEIDRIFGYGGKDRFYKDLKDKLFAFMDTSGYSKDQFKKKYGIR